ncbi:MAG: nitrile hydratase subunit beta, partial [Fimbriimonadaceae bacterium]|nr:nitrile hydratase subunit beta [Alphaproteobacteria bacterium]
MNGPHDMGGMPGFGPIIREAGEPPFHSEWERRAFALTLAMALPGGWNIDMSRHARETLPPGEYITSSYYQIWFSALLKLIVEHGLASQDEIATGASIRPAAYGKRVLHAADVAGVLERGGPVNREPSASPGFAVGDQVRMRNRHPVHHTRCPRYVRGHVGKIA